MARPLDISACIQIVKFTATAGETMLFPYIKDVSGCFALVFKAIEIGRHNCGSSNRLLTHTGTWASVPCFRDICSALFRERNAMPKKYSNTVRLVQRIIWRSCFVGKHGSLSMTINVT
ncbi:hypothetical protein ARMSODRAFT_60799 [Armillaria solidipes]|uniref:Uncharacterized protein n=1 Tax=Armillaria solidipes TaxID=1076256 RepID=A0A2H3CAK2_9AGAR|nr:hypothetical protein ARMSODRAFT_60799 [Armillaria solidipes]